MSRTLGLPAQLLGWLLIFVASTMVLAVWEAIRGARLACEVGWPALYSFPLRQDRLGHCAGIRAGCGYGDTERSGSRHCVQGLLN